MSTVKNELTRAEKHSTLLQEALSRPGAQEAMEVYQYWQKVDAHLNPYRQLVQKHGKTAVSNQSNN